MDFEDHFSAHAEQYAASRPTYPGALFEYLASLAPDVDLAWDCGSGNGQAAVSLAEYFNRVIATDPSADQIENAFTNPRVEYRVEPSETTSIESNTVSLVTAGTAAHWFRFEEFYAEVRRVCKPRGILAVWCYHLPDILPEADRLLQRYLRDILNGYWPDRFRYLDKKYKTLPFPFSEIDDPGFTYETEWTMYQILGFLNSWSGTRQYLAMEGSHPVDLIEKELERAWGTPEQKRTVRWRLHLRIGRVNE